jgi:serine/threonine protein kinase
MKLLDFGAAREYEDSGNKSLSIMLKPGYAPEEQYRTKGKQGPWTDVYALCATIYKCITGITPEESMERLHEDTVKPPSQLGVAIPPAQETALMKGMAVMQGQRWQSMPELYNALFSAPAVQAQPMPVPGPRPMPGPAPQPVAQPIPQPSPTPIVAATNVPVGTTPVIRPPVPAKKRLAIICAIVAVLALAVGGLVWGLSGSDGNSARNINNRSTGGNAVADAPTPTPSSTPTSTPSSTPTSASTPTPSPTVSYHVGDIVNFGRYYSQWRVLDVQDGKALLLSEYVIEDRAYHGEWSADTPDREYETTWAECDLRAYLNGEFLDRYFSEDERSQIAETYIVNDDNPWTWQWELYITRSGGDNTTDRVFLLSVE